jgi:hypothetical protein
MLQGSEERNLSDVIFAVALLSSAVISLNAYLNPTKRWRHLRSCACLLESTLWRYRTRVSEFVTSSTNPKAPEKALIDALNGWRDSLYSGTDLQTTNLGREYPPSVYKHCQFEGQIPGRRYGLKETDRTVGLDNFYAPSKPLPYIHWRLLPALEFHQQKMPKYSRWRSIWVGITLLCTALAAFMAYWGASVFVAIVSSVAAAATAWQEFSDLNRKLERSNTVIQGIKKLHAWWKSLNEVEQASPSNITLLVLTGEAIVTNDFNASPDNKKEGDGDDKDNKNDDDKKKSA